MDKSDFLLTPKMLAERLGITTGALAKWRLIGFGPRHIKIGSAVRYSARAVETFLTEQERRSTSDIGGRQHVGAA